jgi:hypothetical protein
MRTCHKGERPMAGTRPRAACAALLALPLSAVIASCGSPPSHQTSGGSCAADTAAGYFARAQVVFVGTMLAGGTADVAGHRVLVSPARVHVMRYLKGHGPGVVSVTTGVTYQNVVNEDGIEPLAGQHWKIYTQSPRMPYQTSICDGTKPAGGTP